MVALSHATARELGYGRAEGDESRKPLSSVGRKGLGVKIDDLLDLLTARHRAKWRSGIPEFSADECERAGAQIAVAAIRYFMLKFSRAS